MKILPFLRKLEYASAAFYCRQWLTAQKEFGDRSLITEFFSNLWLDELSHFLYLSSLTSEPTSFPPGFKAASEKFALEQKEIVAQPTATPRRNHITPLNNVRYCSDMVGIGSRFYVFQAMFGKRYTKDLDWPDKIAMVRVVDESNHLFYRLLNIIDIRQNYRPLFTHNRTHKSLYRAKRSLILKWSLMYMYALATRLPVDVTRIIIYQLIPARK